MSKYLCNVSYVYKRKCKSKCLFSCCNVLEVFSNVSKYTNTTYFTMHYGELNRTNIYQNMHFKHLKEYMTKIYFLNKNILLTIRIYRSINTCY